MLAHQELLAKSKQGRIDLYFEGDSITRRWGATDYPELLANWKRNFFGWNAAVRLMQSKARDATSKITRHRPPATRAR